MQFGHAIEYVMSAVVFGAIAVAGGLITGDWVMAAWLGVAVLGAFVADGVRRYRSRRADAARYSTPGPWGALPPN